MTKPLLLSLLLFICASIPANANGNTAANALFVEAVREWEAYSEASQGDYATRLQHISKADQNLDSILNDHPGSEIAVRLSTGPVGPIDRHEIEGLLNEVEASACFANPTIECLLTNAIADADLQEPSGLIYYHAMLAISRAAFSQSNFTLGEGAADAVYSSATKERIDPTYKYFDAVVKDVIFGIAGYVEIMHDVGNTEASNNGLRAIDELYSVLEASKSKGSSNPTIARLRLARMHYHLGDDDGTFEQLGAARESIDAMSYGFEKVQTGQSVVEEYANLGREMEAEALARSLFLSDENKAFALIAVARSYAQRGNHKHAVAIMNDVESLVADVSRFHLLRAYSEIADIWSEMGEASKSSEAARKAEVQAQENLRDPEVDAFGRDAIWSHLTTSRLAVGDVEGAMAAAQETANLNESATTSGFEAETAVEMAQYLKGAGDHGAALSVLHEARNFAVKVDYGYENVALGYSDIGAHTEAIALASRIPSPVRRAEAVARIVAEMS
jgi:tetratricopeptide (TPR) repeat protein